MKKFYAILVLAVFLFALSACNQFEERYPADGEETYYTDAEVEELIDEAVADMQEENDEMYDALTVLLDYHALTNDKVELVRATGDDPDNYDWNIDQLREVYGDYFVDQYPEYFTEADFDEPEQQFFEYEYEGSTLYVEYTQYNEVLIIDHVEGCVETCEVFDFNQVDFVMTQDELEHMMEAYLERLTDK